MKKIRLHHFLLTGLLLSLIYSCSKDNVDFGAQGGLLPTHYVSIYDSSFVPSVLTVAAGSSITFLNKTTSSYTVISADSSTIVSPAIGAGLSFYVKPDTLAGSQPVYIYYHNKEHPAVTGTIILTP